MCSTISYTAFAVCSHNGINKEMLADMVEWGIATPYGVTPERWIFSQNDYERIVRAVRFIRDFDLNIPGSALALDLLQELEKKRFEVKNEYINYL